jgi:hypothetical protein
MLLRRFTDFILQGRFQAMGTAFVLAFIPVIGTVSILIAALVTLRKNIVEGGLVFVAASLPLLIQYIAVPAENQNEMLLYIIVIMLMTNVLTWFFAVLLRLYGSWNPIMEASILIGFLAIGLIHILYPDIQDWWVKQFSAYFGKTLEVVDSLRSESAQQDLRLELMTVAKRYATGFAAASILINVLLQLAIARWWQATIFNPGGLPKELQQIRLGYAAAGLFVVMLLLSYFKNSLALDMMPLLYVIFALVGLSFLHYAVSFTKVSWLWITLVYMGIIGLFPFSLMVVAVIGLFDIGLNFRNRINIRLN